jgi:two-component system, OmpR family, phosphate regulon sensor histidine kinase PhoR
MGRGRTGTPRGQGASGLAWRFLLPALAAIGGTLFAAVPWLVWTLERDQIATLVTRLQGEAREASSMLPWTRGPDLDRACAELSARLGTRITVVAPDGTVLGESSQPSGALQNHADRPEIRAALRDGEGHAVRWSGTLDRRLLYVATRQERDGAVRIVRTAVPISSLTEHLMRLRAPLATGLATAVILGLGVAWVLSGAMRRRIDRMVRFAAALAAGRPPPPVGPERGDSLGVLESRLADMARDVQTTLAAMRVERERLEAILRGMVEGVLVTDLDGRVVLSNARARELLRLPPGPDATGRPLVDLVRHPGIAEIPRQLASGQAVVSRDVTLGNDGISLQVNGARLTADDGTPFGLVLVLHDVSELRRLETVRRDFVANVSHELRTPLTAIKGYAETLLGPAGESRETALQFLQVIDRHSERLCRLINDLLTLSDLEFGRTPLQLRALAVEPVIDDVVQILGDRAAQRGLTLTTAVTPGTPRVHADGDRLRQVLIDLVDNAIKYTPEGGRVTIDARPARLDGHVAIELAVTDTGIGIPSQDVPRLTERFFRVDRARSRELGGTGLGLAIVKHIVQAHGGRLVIESALGHGTTARVTLPAVADAAARETQR